MNVTVVEVKQFNKVGKVTYGDATGEERQAMYWLSSAFADKLTTGASIEIKTEERDNRDKTAKEVWISEVDGVGEKKPGGGGGGNGGYQKPAYQPKSREEIHSSNIAGIAKSCAESMTTEHKDKVKLMRDLCAVYWEEVAKCATP